jgi:hypothetical protein
MRDASTQHHAYIHALLAGVESLVPLSDPVTLRDLIEFFEIKCAVRLLHLSVKPHIEPASTG